MTTDLTRLPIFDSSKALCESCELQRRCDQGKTVTAYRPTKFNGLMIVGEGPGQQEVIRRRPFVGPSGRLLSALMTSIGLDLDECYITNATLCDPPPHNKSFMKDFPNAVPSCIPRLEAEIEAVKPKVVLTLGAAAWAAISGQDEVHVKHVPFTCEHCNEHRKIGPVLQCAAQLPNPADGGQTSIPCGHIETLYGYDTENVDLNQLEALRAAKCPKCDAARKRLRPKMIKCPQCGGRKRREEEYAVFKWPFNVGAVAGGIFEPATHEGFREAHELISWYGKVGVQYVVPAVHPSMILRGQEFAAKTLQKHLAKVRRLLEGKKPIEITHSVTNNATVLRAWLYPKGKPRSDNAAIDTETVATITDEEGDSENLDARKIRNVTALTCFGISFDGHEAMVVDMRGCKPEDADDPLLQVIYEFLTDIRIGKTYHHGAGYDLPVIDRVLGIPVKEQLPSYTDDTMGAHTNLYPDLPHKLGGVTFEMVDARAWKPARTVKGAMVHESFEELAAYNARDTCHTALARDAMGVRNGKAIPGGRMDRAKLSEIYRLDSDMRRVAVDMTMNGSPADLELFRQAGDTARSHTTAARETVQQGLRETGHPDPESLNLNSGPQLNQLLYKFFSLPVIKVTDGGAGATDRDTLVKLMSVTQDEGILKVLNGLLELNKHIYVERNYIDSAEMKPWEDNRIHAVWKPWGTKTGRFSSSPNFQNWPGWLRKLVVAPDGRRIVGVDADQLELRNMGYLSGDKDLIRRCLTADENRKLEPEHDPHSYVASIAFQSRYTGLLLKDPAHNTGTKEAPLKCKCQTCRRKMMRDLTKRIIYGLNYGAGDQTVLEAIYDGGYEGPPITLDVVAHVKRTVFKVWADVLAWREEQVRLARTSGELRSPLLGRRRIFPLNGDFGCSVPITETYNYPIQSLGADLMNIALLKFAERLPELDASALLFAQVHDAIYAEVDEDKAEAVVALLTDCMTSEHTSSSGVTMIFSASGGYGDTWKID